MPLWCKKPYDLSSYEDLPLETASQFEILVVGSIV
jgi:hypothetical protein